METLKGYLPLNFEVMGNPINWIIIPLMIILAGSFLALIYHPSNPA